MAGERTILRGTTVIDVRDGSARRAVDITIEHGRIASITTTSGDHPDRVPVVDARETYAVPGFCDMHAHPLAGRSNPEPALRLMLACGITGFRQMGGSRTLLDDRSNGRLSLPVDGPALLSTPGDVLLPFNAGTEDVALQSVRQQADAGADFIKVAMVTPQVFFPPKPKRPGWDSPLSVICRSESTSEQPRTAGCDRSNTSVPVSASSRPAATTRAQAMRGAYHNLYARQLQMVPSSMKRASR
jgi:hypothetical protein